MQPPPERPMLSPPSTSTMVNTPPASTRRVTPSASSMTDETIRQSLDTVKAPKSPMLTKKPVPKRTNSVQVHNHHDNNSDDADRDGATSYFDHSPAPSQFLGSRGRPLSFYDMKEQQKQTRPPPAPLNLRNSWRASGEMPYNYADIIGDNRYGYAPPRLGQRSSTYQGPSGPPPTTTDIYLGLPWTMWMNSEVKNMFVAAIGEWVGTTLFLFFAFAGTQVANAHSKTPVETTTNATAGFSPIVMLYISVSFGFSLMVNVWIFFRISGGLFIPAVSLSIGFCKMHSSDFAAGNTRSMGNRCSGCHTRSVSFLVANNWQYNCIRVGSRHVPNPTKRTDNSLRRHFTSPRCFH